MVIGVMSDTHGNRRLMHKVAADMTGRFAAEMVFHLGDYYEDALELEALGYRVRMVPGLWCPEYRDARTPKRMIEEVAGLTVACAHADKDLRHRERAAAIVLTGHTHEAKLALLGRSLYVNPGHLKTRGSRGEPASFAVLDIGPAEVRATIIEAASGVVRDEIAVDRARLGEGARD